MIRRHLAVWATAPWLGTIVGTLAVATAIGGGAIVVALVGTAPMLAAALGATFLAGHWTTSRTIGPRPACRPGRQSPSRSADAAAAPRHRAARCERAAHRARRPASRGGAGRRALKTSVAATLAPTTGRPAIADPGAPYSPAAVVSPAPAAAGSTLARGHAGSPTVYVPGRVPTTAIPSTTREQP